MSEDPPVRARGRLRRRLPNWRLVSRTGASVVSLRQLDAKTQLRVTAPSMITGGNLLCGFTSVLMAFSDRFQLAAALIALAVFLDICDGAVARLVGATSPIGVQLDSMADLISFGLAPAILVHTWTLDKWPVVSYVFAFFWLACAAFRLARFNITVDPLADKRYFIGLPSPGAAGAPVATVFAFQTEQIESWVWLPLAVSIVPAVLMVSNVRFRSFRTLLNLRHGPKWQLIAVVVPLIAGLVMAPRWTGLVLAYGYVLTAPLGWLTAPLRVRWFGSWSVAPPRTRMPSVFLASLADTSGEPEDESSDAEDPDDETTPRGDGTRPRD